MMLLPREEFGPEPPAGDVVRLHRGFEGFGKMGEHGVELGSLEEAAADVVLLEHPDRRAVAPELLVCEPIHAFQGSQPRG